jgi:hypothetical protein
MGTFYYRIVRMCFTVYTMYTLAKVLACKYFVTCPKSLVKSSLSLVALANLRWLSRCPQNAAFTHVCMPGFQCGSQNLASQGKYLLCMHVVQCNPDTNVREESVHISGVALFKLHPETVLGE